MRKLTEMQRDELEKRMGKWESKWYGQKPTSWKPESVNFPPYERYAPGGAKAARFRGPVSFVRVPGTYGMLMAPPQRKIPTHIYEAQRHWEKEQILGERGGWKQTPEGIWVDPKYLREAPPDSTPEQVIAHKVDRIAAKAHGWGQAKVIPTAAELQFLRQNRPDLLHPGSPIYHALTRGIKAAKPQALREFRREFPSLFIPPKPLEKVAIGSSGVMLPSVQATRLAEIRKRREEEYNKQLASRQAAMKAAGLNLTKQVPILKTIGVFKIK